MKGPVFSAIGTALICVSVMSLAGLTISAAYGQEAPDVRAQLGRCRAIQDESARLRCYEDATAPPASALTPPGHGSWRLVRTPNPAGGTDAISIMQTADLSRSDLDFAGLMVRCGDATAAIQVLLVVVQPFHPRVHPRVRVSAGAIITQFTASIVPPGALVLLPPEASALAMGPWQGAPELSIEVGGDQGPLRGVVPLTGMSGALHELRSNCPTQ
jgi:hypothetical protein